MIDGILWEKSILSIESSSWLLCIFGPFFKDLQLQDRLENPGTKESGKQRSSSFLEIRFKRNPVRMGRLITSYKIIDPSNRNVVFGQKKNTGRTEKGISINKFCDSLQNSSHPAGSGIINKILTEKPYFFLWLIFDCRRCQTIGKSVDERFCMKPIGWCQLASRDWPQRSSATWPVNIRHCVVVQDRF